MIAENSSRAVWPASGAGDLLLQRTVDAFGHCGLGAADLSMAFLSLVQWVRTGERPAA